MHLAGDILAVEQFYRVANVSRKNLEGKILAAADESTKISPSKILHYMVPLTGHALLERSHMIHYKNRFLLSMSVCLLHEYSLW